LPRNVKKTLLKLGPGIQDAERLKFSMCEWFFVADINTNIIEKVIRKMWLMLA